MGLLASNAPGALLDARLVLFAVDALQRLDVIPARHDKPHVEGDWPLWSVGKDEAHVGKRRLELLSHICPAMARVTEAMEDDDCRSGA